MRRLRPHLSYADVMVTLLAIGALTGGVAYAANTIGSADVINESLRSQDLKNDNVTGDDVLESSLKQGTTWRLVGAAGQPAFGDTESCDWSNYDSVHSSAAFTRDAAGFVHLKGTLKTRQGPGVCENDDRPERAVFVLPPGYRPQNGRVAGHAGGGRRNRPLRLHRWPGARRLPRRRGLDRGYIITPTTCRSTGSASAAPQPA